MRLTNLNASTFNCESLSTTTLARNATQFRIVEFDLETDTIKQVFSCE